MKSTAEKEAIADSCLAMLERCHSHRHKYDSRHLSNSSWGSGAYFVPEMLP